MFTSDMKAIVCLPLIYLLSKTSSDLTWLWYRSLSRLNFKNLNKLIANDLVHGLPIIKFDNDSLCATYDQGKQHR